MLRRLHLVNDKRDKPVILRLSQGKGLDMVAELLGYQEEVRRALYLDSVILPAPGGAKVNNFA